MADLILKDSAAQASTSPFDSIRRYRADGSEYWLGRELMKMLGYVEWRNFEYAIQSAIENIEFTGENPSCHTLLLATKRTLTSVEPSDYELSRFACYHVALACDGRGKPEVKAAKQYFVVKTREAEIPKIPQTYAAALLEAGRLALENEQLQATIKASAPLVDYAQAVQHSASSVDFNEFAKMIGTGRTRLFRAMRESGVIMKNSTLPYQQFCDAGYFEVSQEITEDGKLVPFAVVTGKGQIWLKQRLLQSIDTQRQMIAAIAGSVSQMSLL